MFISVNPSTEQEIFRQNYISNDDLKHKIDNAYNCFKIRKHLPINERLCFLESLKLEILKNRQHCAEIITLEVGKPIVQSLAEIDKCVKLLEHYQEYGEIYLQDEIYNSEYETSKMIFQPLGVVFGIMPWNFPFWQIFRFAIPAMVAGNCVLIKQAPNAGLSAKEVENLFNSLNIKGLYQNLFCSIEQVESIIADPYIQGISLTGSTNAGSKVAEIAGKYIKPQVLELGGSDVFLVDKSADLEKLLPELVQSRLQNSGQSCISAKRILVHHEKIDDITSLLIERLKRFKIGNPAEEDVEMGPLARKDLKDNFENLVSKSKAAGTNELFRKSHEQKNGFFSDITIFLCDKIDNPLMQEEVFGPCFVFYTYKTLEEAIEITNRSEFGLSASIWSNDLKVQQKCIQEIESGAVFINQFSKSDVRFAFGGIKKSGYGREMGKEGVLAFCNKKLILGK